MFTPRQFNENEILDDPKVPLQLRQKLLLELDQTNIKYGTYQQFCGRFFKWLDSLELKTYELSILEIGSGSGGLAREILMRPQSRWKLKYSIMDQDPNILAWAQENLRKHNLSCEAFPSTDTHLKQFYNDSFDIVLSLHVIHHIHPSDVVQKMFQEVFRIARVGFFMADFERRLGNVVMTKVVNTLGGLSSELNSDGVKSVKRSYTKSEIASCLQPTPNDYLCSIDQLFPFPHMIIKGKSLR